ncbi:hypothetical protein GEMRC1_007502 [Eukaryota sp. GEM-RC1]
MEKNLPLTDIENGVFSFKPTIPKKNTLDWSLNFYSPVVTNRTAFHFISNLITIWGKLALHEENANPMVIDSHSHSEDLKFLMRNISIILEKDFADVFIDKYYSALSSKLVKDPENLFSQVNLLKKLLIVILPVINTLKDKTKIIKLLENFDHPERIFYDFLDQDLIPAPLSTLLG